MRLRKDKPVRLEKKTTISERIQYWIDSNSFYFIIFGVFIIMVLLIILLFAFVHSGTESGLWYNYHGGV